MMYRMKTFYQTCLAIGLADTAAAQQHKVLLVFANDIGTDRTEAALLKAFIPKANS